MRTNRQSADAASEPPNAAKSHANFLAIKQQFQSLEAENADWNRKKTFLKGPRRWSKKRPLVPPAARIKAIRPSGAQQGNSNRLKHGTYSRESQLFRALIRTHIRAGRALVVCVAG